MLFDIEVLMEQLKRHEGLSLESYQDSLGIWSIGFGRNVQTMKISEYLAKDWLKEDIEKVEKQLESYYPVVNRLSSNRQIVLLNMTFNLGLTGVGKFKKMWRAINSGNFIEASAQMKDSLWHKQVGERAVELEQMMRAG